MRALLFTVFAAFALAGSALAEPMPIAASVEVKLSPELRKKAVDDYGLRDVERLASELRKDVEREIRQTGILAGGRLELILIDARPNRPTFKQLGDRPDLSMASFGVGGARIEGLAISADGVVTPIAYDWYETDIRQARMNSTWSDAEYAIGSFADRLGRGETYAGR